jgi:hypothetical protein
MPKLALKTVPHRRIPTIQSVGLPPKIHADRVTSEMLSYIIKSRHARWQKLFEEWRSGSVGNPLGQARMVRRMKQAAGAFLLAIHLTPGKRARFKLDLVEVAGWDPERDNTIEQDDIAPQKPWLAIVSTVVDMTGREPSVETGAALLITYHSLSRLAQRCHARHPRDLVMAARSAYGAYVGAYEAGTWPNPLPPCGHRLGVSLASATCSMTDAVAVVAPHATHASRAPVIVTILPPDAD